MLLLGAIAEMLEAWPTITIGQGDWSADAISICNTTIPDMIRILQKKIKYGLNSKAAIVFYEMGFSDRVLAQELVSGYDPELDTSAKSDFISASKENIRTTLICYPSYFSTILETLV